AVIAYMSESGNPFIRNLLYMKVGFKTVSETALTVYLLNNQQFTTKTSYDRSAPEMILDSFGGRSNIGDVLEIGGGRVYDVLSEISSFTLSVIGPDGRYVVSDNGIILNNVDATVKYSFTIADYGSYRVNYTATDDSTRSGENKTEKNIQVIDEEAPLITVNGAYEAAYKLNDKIDPISATVSDNKTVSPRLTVYIERPDGSLEKFTESYTLAVQGIYRVIYFAEDEAFNNSVKHFEIRVEGATE
ncbi:MAG: hypothetical protein J6Y43_00895, partial [Clostridia bacterium]|nr:hypothetical protein [Clostridia bacterium]